MIISTKLFVEDHQVIILPNYFVEGHPVIISTKLFCILTTCFREDFLSLCYSDKPHPLAAISLTDQISVSYY